MAVLFFVKGQESGDTEIDSLTNLFRAFCNKIEYNSDNVLFRRVLMKTLLIFRHAKSSWKDESIPDQERPLNKRGQKDAPFMGKLMKTNDLLPDLVMCSTAVRARDTIKLAAEAADYSGEIRFSEDLYTFEAGPYLDALTQLDDRVKSVMLVGHNPGMEELLAGLVGEYQALPTAALAELELPIERWKQVSFGMHARLKAILRPKEEKKQK